MKKTILITLLFGFAFVPLMPISAHEKGKFNINRSFRAKDGSHSSLGCGENGSDGGDAD